MKNVLNKIGFTIVSTFVTATAFAAEPAATLAETAAAGLVTAQEEVSLVGGALMALTIIIVGIVLVLKFTKKGANS